MAWEVAANIKGPQGDQGDQGEQGEQGVRGNTWFSGAGAPDVIPGSMVGDFYLNTTNGDVYKLA